jgi:hypothetical protein
MAQDLSGRNYAEISPVEGKEPPERVGSDSVENSFSHKTAEPEFSDAEGRLGREQTPGLAPSFELVFVAT